MSSDSSVSIHPMLPLIFPTLESEGLSDAIDIGAAWHYYSHLIQRNPKDLKSHTRRIFLAMQHKDAALLSGALQDLFITLKGAGTQLRIRLLKASAPYLKKSDVIYFAKWIKLKSDQESDYRWVDGSVLSTGLNEFGKELILKEQQEREDRPSALEEARSCIEYGQLDLAKNILEEALMTEKDNQEIKDELASIQAALMTENKKA